MTIHANSTQTADVPFPKELIGSRAVIQGASGAGKTYAIRRILETTHGRMQHLVLDVEDELFTLRERFDYVLDRRRRCRRAAQRRRRRRTGDHAP